MKKLSEIASMEPSPVRKIFEMAQKMEDIVNFSLGEPNFVTPEPAIATISP